MIDSDPIRWYNLPALLPVLLFAVMPGAGPSIVKQVSVEVPDA